jgi:hypothetical protein
MVLLVFVLHFTISQTCDRCDLTGEYVELAALENLLDDLCDSSLHWQSTSQLSSEEESNFEKPVSFSI